MSASSSIIAPRIDLDGNCRRSSTIIDFTTMPVMRIGVCYELPADPGRDALAWKD